MLDIQSSDMRHIQGGQKLAHFLHALTSHAVTSSSIDRFLNLFHFLNQENICNNTVNKYSTTPALPCEMSAS